MGNKKVAKGVITCSNQLEEDFFKGIKPLLEGSNFLIEMDSGMLVEHLVYLDFDLNSIHIEQTKAIDSDSEKITEIISV